MAVPCSERGNGLMRGKSAEGSIGTIDAISAARMHTGATFCQTVENLQVMNTENQRFSGGRPVYCLHVSWVKSRVNEGSCESSPEILFAVRPGCSLPRNTGEAVTTLTCSSCRVNSLTPSIRGIAGLPIWRTAIHRGPWYADASLDDKARINSERGLAIIRGFASGCSLGFHDMIPAISSVSANICTSVFHIRVVPY